MNAVAFGMDEGTIVIKIGKDSPLATFSNGKVVQVKKTELLTFNLKLLTGSDESSKDGEIVKPQNVKELGQSETFAQGIKFAPTGRYFAVIGDHDFVIYAYPKFQNAAFGPATDLVWSTHNSSQTHTFAVKLENGLVKIYKNFSEYKAFKTSFTNEGIYGGRLLGIRSKDFITFYDWDDFNVVRRIDLGQNLKQVLWSEDGNKVVLGLEENFFLLEFHPDLLEKCLTNGTLTAEDAEDGFEEAFTFLEEFTEQINSGQWISQNCFVFINNRGNINYLIGNRIVKLGNADKKQHILGYDGKQSRLYLIDKSLNIYAHRLLLSVIDFQDAILNGNPQKALSLKSQIPESFFGKLAKFLEQNSQKAMAFDLTPDQDHKFDLALQLNRVKEAYEIAELQNSSEKFKKVGDIALLAGQFTLAEQCFEKSQDFNSLLLFYSSYGNADGL